MLTRLVSTIVVAGIGFALVAGPAQAADDIEAKVQTCAVCHGANGTPLDPKTMPNIWGQQPYYILKQLMNYRNGMRTHPVMTAIARGLQDADLRPIAAYFAGKTWPANPTPAAAAPPPNGIAMCVPCHQQKFEGGPSWPRLAGLNYDYLVSAMRAFATEERTNNEDMVKIMKMFSDGDREAMARYLAGM